MRQPKSWTMFVVECAVCSGIIIFLIWATDIVPRATKKRLPETPPTTRREPDSDVR
jgi:hypothetical protein